MTDETEHAIEEAVKIGRRNSAADAGRIQAAHDTLVDLGAACAEAPEITEIPMPKSLDDDTLVYFGDAVKALGDGRVGGYLVRFSSASDPDISAERDYFTAASDFDTDWPGKSSVYFNHGLDAKLGHRKLSTAVLTKDVFGIWAETILKQRDEYEKFIYQLAEEGKLGWSSGTAPHLVERKADGDTHHITRWPLGLDASLTHTPAEPRNSVVPLKFLITVTPPQPAEVNGTPAQHAEPEAEAEPAISQLTPNPTEIKTMEITEERLSELLDGAADKAIKGFVAAQPTTNGGGYNVQVTHDEADVPFSTIAAQCKAVKDYAKSNGRTMAPQLKRLEDAEIKATGASEAVPSDGGFLLEPTLTQEIIKPVHQAGPFSNKVKPLPVSGNSNYGWINGVDETDRATGSRWGGIRGYRLAEGDTKTASKPKFRRINWELKKYAILVYGTDELLADASQFSAIVQQGASEELAFMVNDDLFSGLGTAGPLGIMKAPCLVTANKESGQAAATITNENLMKMWVRLLSSSKANAEWYYNADVLPQLHQLTFSAGVSAFEPRFVNYSPDGSIRIFGRPAIENEFSETLGTAGDLVVADFSEYLFWEKGGVQAASSIHVQFLTDETVFRFVYRCDGQPVRASALTPYKGTSNTMSSFVALQTRA